MNLFKKFFQEKDGQDGVEYALLIGFVSVAIVATANSFTTAFNTFWTDAGTAVSNAGAAAAALPGS